MEPIEIKGLFMDDETSLWAVAGFHIASRLLDAHMALPEPGILTEEHGGPLPDDCASWDIPEEEVGPFEFGAEGCLLWDALGSGVFVLKAGYSLPLEKVDPSARVTWGVRVSQLDFDRVAEVFAVFCGWLTDWTDPNGEFPMSRPVREARRRLGVRLGQEAWTTPWLDHLGFARWAWSKGLLREGMAWKGLVGLDPYACGLLHRPPPPAQDVSLSYSDRVRLGLEG